MTTKKPTNEWRKRYEDEFLAKLREAFARGEVEYGDASFFGSLDRNVSELTEELIDVAGWAFILWVQIRLRLEMARARAQQVPYVCPRCFHEFQ